ncbi:MAG TPA: class I SAM-dependent rRNA methyltransferase [Polyangia bacterium]|nr:class I SAM-dependent rRNA methyltransferase [Polyangia bacterium]
MSRPARVVLRKNLARAIRQGHPWLYREALRPAAELGDGDVVEVVTADGRALARGYWDATSPIAVRIVSDEHAGDVQAVVAERVAAALVRRLAFIDLKRTDAFRWIHGEADGLPGVHVDVYGQAAVLRFDGGGARVFYRALPAVLSAVAAQHGLNVGAVVERRRGARGGSEADGAGEAGGETAVALLGALPPAEIEVRENGLRFGVDLAHGQKGGLFLDQRDNRARVGALAAGKRVLNLFGYTGGFSLYAAAGGASETTTVDVARGAIAAARGNFARNALDPASAHFFAEDAFTFLERAARDGRQWDLVISDPPSFAPSHQALPRALGAYRRLHRLCAAVIASGGLLCAASCSSHVDRAAFLATVEQGVREAGRRWSLRQIDGAGPDHPVAASFPEGDYLKFAIGSVE